METTRREVKQETQRLKTVTRRMVGMYRLMYEQATEEKDNMLRSYVNGSLSYGKWRNFKKYVRHNLHTQLTSRDAMIKTIRTSAEDTGSLKDLLWKGNTLFPQQAFSIKVGNVMETSIRNFLADNFFNMEEVIAEPVTQFAGYRVQMDLAIKKDNIVVVSELKYNMNLDTEKSKAIVDKLDLLNLFLKDYYRKYNAEPVETNVNFVSLRYPTSNDIPKLKPVLEAVRPNYIIGYQQLFNFFDIHVTSVMWKTLHNEISDEIKRSFNSYINYA